MILSHRLMQYLTAVSESIDFRGNPDSIPTTDRCPECGMTIDTYLSAIDGEHIVLRLSGDVYAVVVGCEGHWVINPALVGINSDTWTDPNGNTPESGSSTDVSGPEWDRPVTMD